MKYLTDYFGERLKPFSITDEVKEILPKLSPINKEILFELGIPEYEGHGGRYLLLPNLKIYKNRYLCFYTREYVQEYFKECVDIETNNALYIMNIGGTEDIGYINIDLEAYLNYIMVFEKFHEEYIIPDKLGNYNIPKNSRVYAATLKKKFMEVDNRLYPNQAKKYGFERSDAWLQLFYEMDAGAI